MLKLILGLALLAQDPTEDWTHPWHGATVGTRLKVKVTLFQPVTAPDNSVEYEPKAHHRTETVVKAGGNFVRVRRQSDDGGGPGEIAVYTGRPAELRYARTQSGTEELKVGAKTFSCTVYEFRAAMQLLRVWKAAGTPTWAVKQRMWLDTRKKDNPSGWVEELVGLDQEVKVGSRPFKCAVVKRTTIMKFGRTSIENIETTWRSDAVPGGVVKRVVQNFMNGKEQKQQGLIEELVEFEKKQ